MTKSKSGGGGNLSRHAISEKAARDNRSRQLNPEHSAYRLSRGKNPGKKPPRNATGGNSRRPLGESPHKTPRR